MNDWYNFDGKDSLIEDYENYIHALKQVPSVQGMQDMNIYAQYIQLNKNRINRELLQRMYDYWNADPGTPFSFPRYQHDSDKNLAPVDNLDWRAAQEDIDKVVSQWKNHWPASDFSTENHINGAWIHGDKVYFNPYKKDFMEVRLNNGDALNKKKAMSFMRANRFSPSMVDIPSDRVHSVIQNGWEVSPDNMRKLQNMPFSVEFKGVSRN